MSLPEFPLYCGIDGECLLKEEGKALTYAFTDILQAIDHLMPLSKYGGVTLTVYDPLGKMTFKIVL